MFIPKPITETLLGLLQVQSQALELQGVISLTWATQMETMTGGGAETETGKGMLGSGEHRILISNPSVSPHGFQGVHKWQSL